MSFAAASACMRSLTLPTGLPTEWESPYRLLAGAAYSIGLAEGLSDGGGLLPPIDANWWPALESSANTKEITTQSPDWFPTWFGSYALTNSIFRVAAATEKMAYLVGELGQRDRKFFWRAVRQARSTLSLRVPAAHRFLGQMPSSRKKRAGRLGRIRTAFASFGTLKLPLMCAFIQTDIDKHVPYQPLKRLPFDRLLATKSLEQASEIWNQAVHWRLNNP